MSGRDVDDEFIQDAHGRDPHAHDEQAHTVQAADAVEEPVLDVPRELLRQQVLLRSVSRLAPPATLAPWLKAQPVSAMRALAAYQAHASASAENALAASYPTVQALMGQASFAHLAQALWYHRPPTRGDLAWFGETLPGFIERDEQLVDVPYLADVARLDWAMCRAETAADVSFDAASLALLSDADPGDITLVLAAGMHLIVSTWPIVTLHQAHHVQTAPAVEPARQSAWGAKASPMAKARAALAAHTQETALVWRVGWKARALAVSAAHQRFFGGLLSGQSLAAALDAAGDSFDFSASLQHGLQQGWLMGARRLTR